LLRLEAAMNTNHSVVRTIPALVLLAGALSAAPAAAQALEGYFPEVTLVTQDGKRVRFYSDLVKGRVVLINFIFTRCKDLCPRTTTNIRRVQELLGDEAGRTVHLISISVDPDNDTPAVLKAYAETAGATPGWDFLTGDQEDIELIRRKLGVFDREEDDNPTLHTGMLVYGNEPKGKWRAIYAMANPDLIVKSVLKVVDRESPQVP
jgi:protein SCO1